ncbi:MAG: hypothetical protein U0796_03515 [Gemmatales bacterium]
MSLAAKLRLARPPERIDCYMITGPQVILVLKIAVVLVTMLLLASAVALVKKNYRLHGLINTLMCALTLGAVVLFEIVIRLMGVDVKAHMNEDARFALRIHLCFVIPLVPILVWMLVSGWKRQRRMHLSVSVIFLILWTGMFVTGLFFLPHQ